MKEELRTTRPIACEKRVPILDHEDPTAEKHEIDWERFSYDSNRRVYILKPLSEFDKSVWLYTEEFMKKWEQDLKDVVFVLSPYAKSIGITR